MILTMCYFCGASIGADTKIYRSSTCPSCGKDLKICLNCRFYDPGVHWQCRETIPEPVREKDRANFCDYFQLNTVDSRGTDGRTDEKAREQFKSLFGDE
jgi:predicted RNA-binding Zn-ribbon protein involved in translation (DUF1610 family)